MRSMRISLAIPLALILAIGTSACARTEISGSPTTGNVAAESGSAEPTQLTTQPATIRPSSQPAREPSSQPSSTAAPPTEASAAPAGTSENSVPATTSPPEVTSVPDPGTARPPADSSTSDALAPFFAAADTADAALAAAAAAVNDSYAGDQVTFTQATVDLLNRARPSAVAAAIPAGLDPDTERAVLLVYSDLESRFAALHGESCVQVGTYARAELDPHCFT
jgi:hypothetical protein